MICQNCKNLYCGKHTSEKAKAATCKNYTKFYKVFSLRIFIFGVFFTLRKHAEMIDGLVSMQYMK